MSYCEHINGTWNKGVPAQKPQGAQGQIFALSTPAGTAPELRLMR